ncbi:hypothetical protein NIES4101_77590 [Calothrix sp. NIES-4101]|nr:hypothetical protein NIES4101_77590 [Calothrix sp. NIES-4101]
MYLYSSLIYTCRENHTTRSSLKSAIQLILTFLVSTQFNPQLRQYHTMSHFLLRNRKILKNSYSVTLLAVLEVLV